MSFHSYLIILPLEQCIPPKRLPHGQVTDDSKNIFIEGDTISFHCDVGYQPEHQSPVATCTRKDWSPALNCLATCKLHFYVLLAEKLGTFDVAYLVLP